MFRTPTMANFFHRTLETINGDILRFTLRKLDLLLTVDHFQQVILMDIAQFVVRKNEMIT